MLWLQILPNILFAGCVWAQFVLANHSWQKLFHLNIDCGMIKFISIGHCGMMGRLSVDKKFDENIGCGVTYVGYLI